MRTLLRAVSIERQTTFVVRLSGQEFDGSIWDGERLKSPLSLDTETTVVTDLKRSVPELILASASDGEQHVVIPAARVEDFLRIHKGCDWVFHNFAFDARVLLRFLGQRASTFLDVMNDGRLADTLVLASCIQLFERGRLGTGLDLGTLTAKHTGFVVDKSSPYRTRFHELQGRDLATVDPNFLNYAVGDAIATWHVHSALQQLAAQLLEPLADQIDQEFLKRYGWFCEDVHARASLVLAEMSASGVHVDLDRQRRLKSVVAEHIQEAVSHLESLPDTAGLFPRDKTGSHQRTSHGAPSISLKRVRKRLETIATEHHLQIDRTPTGQLKVGKDDWHKYRDIDPFVNRYLEFRKWTKLVEYFKKYQQLRVYPQYRLLVTTGRTAAAKPNIQQLPRHDGFRSFIVPPPKHVFVICDFSFIELVTLAAHTTFRSGSSRLADAIRQGRDPHAFTASQVLGVEYDEFLLWKETRPAEYQARRQAAKAVNFGVGGGLGAERLRRLARNNYGVSMSGAEAAALRESVIRDVYPDIGHHLDADAFTPLASNLGISEEELEFQIDRRGLWLIERVVAGQPPDGLDPVTEDQVWQALLELCQNRRLMERILNREAGSELARDLFFYPAANFAGFARGRCGYTDRKNHPFQSLAALGYKLALWRLLVAGYTPVIAVHDEVVVAIRQDSELAAKQRNIEDIMVTAMQEFTRGIPVHVDSVVSTTWAKPGSR